MTVGAAAVRVFFAALAAVGLLALTPGDARAEEPSSRPQETPPVQVALVVGVNRAVDANLAALKYADDDAVRWRGLFSRLGVRTRLLARLDENTRRVHPEAVSEATSPVAAELDKAVSEAAAEIAAARARGAPTVLYFVYAGHGDVRNGQGYITLEDARLTGRDLAERVIARIGAARAHVIVDACGSFFLAYGRGPGGERRAVDATITRFDLAADPTVGLLLSTSSARDSHEWDAVQGGVFSHEVRSGMLGAADADGDGKITYREVAAFVARANAGIANERFRPDVHARAPAAGDPVLVDVRKAQAKRIEIDGRHAGHYIVEDSKGVRHAELHSAPGQAISLVRPSDDKLYILRAGAAAGAAEREYAVSPDAEIVALASLDDAEPRARSRGAIHEAFQMLFTVPFDRSAVDEYREPSPEELAAARADGAGSPRDAASARLTPRSSTRRTVGWATLGGGAAGLATAGALALASSSVASGAGANEAQADIADRNDRISTLNTGATIGLVAGGVAALVGGALLLWPDPKGAPAVSISRDGARLGLGARF